MGKEGGELSGGDHGRLVHHQHRPAVQLDPATLEVQQQPVDGARISEAFLGQTDGGDPGRGGAQDLVAVQLEGLPGQPERPGLAAARPADHHGHAGTAPAEVLDHRLLVLPGGGVPVQDLTDDIRPNDGAPLVGALSGAVDQLPLKCQQL
jgi:hypothetical protein